jgi:hypothetical protein
MHRLRVISHNVKPIKRSRPVIPSKLTKSGAEVIVFHPSQIVNITKHNYNCMNIVVNNVHKKPIIFDDPLVNDCMYQPIKRVNNTYVTSVIDNHICMNPDEVMDFLAFWKLAIVGVVHKYKDIGCIDAQLDLASSLERYVI